MNDDRDFVNVEYEDIKNEIYVTAPQLAQKIGDTDTRVRHWAENYVFGDLIGIEKVNGRKRYKESDIPKFAFVKELADKNFTHEQIKVYISKNGFKYAEYDGGLIDVKDPLGFQALASALSLEVNSKLVAFTEQLSINIANQLAEHLVQQQQLNAEIKAELEASVDEIIDGKIAKVMDVKKDLQNLIIEKIDSIELQAKTREDKIFEITGKQEEIKNLHLQNKEDLQNLVADTLESIELRAKTRDDNILETLKKGMEERKIEAIQLPVQKRSIWDKLTGK